MISFQTHSHLSQGLALDLVGSIAPFLARHEALPDQGCELVKGEASLCPLLFEELDDFLDAGVFLVSAHLLEASDGAIAGIPLSALLEVVSHGAQSDRAEVGGNEPWLRPAGLWEEQERVPDAALAQARAELVGRALGQVGPEDILDEAQSSFCIATLVNVRSVAASTQSAAILTILDEMLLLKSQEDASRDKRHVDHESRGDSKLFALFLLETRQILDDC